MLKCATHSRDVAQIEEVVDLGGSWQEALDDFVIQLDRALRHDVTNRLHFLLEVHQLLVDHASEDALDLRLLQSSKNIRPPYIKRPVEFEGEFST